MSIVARGLGSPNQLLVTTGYGIGSGGIGGSGVSPIRRRQKVPDLDELAQARREDEELIHIIGSLISRWYRL